MKVVGEYQAEQDSPFAGWIGKWGRGGASAWPENIRDASGSEGLAQKASLTSASKCQECNWEEGVGQERAVAGALNIQVAWGQGRSWGLWLSSTQA